MRKINALVTVSLDGVMQALGGADEDRTGGFELGGWVWPYSDDVVRAVLREDFSKPFDLLLGRFTYDIFASYWPHSPTEPGQPGYNDGFAFSSPQDPAASLATATAPREPEKSTQSKDGTPVKRKRPPHLQIIK